MMSCLKRIDRRGVALFIVLTSMATLSIFVSEVTYTAQINQKLAYDRLDQLKSLALAKSGLRLALLRIRAYSEIQKAIGQFGGSDVTNSVIPKAMIDKIWAEPVTIPFSGDLGGLPTEMKDALTKFRKNSGMEGKLYISIQAQSSKVNLNSTLSAFAALAPEKSKSKNPNTGGAGAQGQQEGQQQGQGQGAGSGEAEATVFDPNQARQALGQQIQESLQRKFEEDEKFRDEYRNFRVEELVEEILGWSDLSYDSPREQISTVPFKRAPFYHMTELNYLPSMDDKIFELLSTQFSAGVASTINVNTIRLDVLRALIPQMTKEEAEKFFEFRDGRGANGEDNKFKSSDDFYRYIQEKVKFFAGSQTRATDLKKAFTQRGIQLVTEEVNFLVRIEATVQQTKRTLEAMVSLLDSKQKDSSSNGGMPGVQSPNPPVNPAAVATDRSNIKITQLRFL
jgi:type II secretory pathway component PulK